MSLTPGTRLGQYELLEQLGTGGMGAVYKAHDPTLQRTVAIKVLAKQDEDASARLLQEARAASALDHPNICTIYEVGEHPSAGSGQASQAFIVMAYVEGKPLSACIPEGGLPPDSVIRYGTQIADALAHAHERGIVHRDLKSLNVMITPEGRAKVLDFGLAARMPKAEVEAVTKTQEALPINMTGMVVGTLAYMAPEVLRGEAATARSDIWALGVLLYEMASGRLPFDGTTVTDVISAVVKDSPAALPSKASAGLRTIAQRCLQKEPGQRYGHAAAVQAALEAIQSSGAETRLPETASPSPAEFPAAPLAETGATGVPWIAVLPFKVRGGDEEVRGLAEGLTEEIVTGLSQFPHLSVLGANATLPYQDRGTDVRAIGRELGVRYVIEGSLRTSGQNLRVSVQLLDATTGTSLWAERYDRKLDDADIFQLQDDLTDRIVATVADPFGALARGRGELARAKSPEALTADESVLLCFGFLQRIGPDEHLRARTALEQAVASHPRHATAWACLSLLHVEEYRHNFNSSPGALDRALDGARRAVAIDPTSQLGHHALAIAHYFRRDLSAFRTAAERATALNPRDTFTLAHMGLFTVYGGDWTSGTRMARRAMTLNPHHPGWYHFADVLNHYRQKDYEQALAAAQKVNLPLKTDYHFCLAAINAQLGRQGAAREAVRELLAVDPGFAATARREYGKWFFVEDSRAMLEHLFDGLRKAGLEIPDPERLGRRRDGTRRGTDRRDGVARSRDRRPALREHERRPGAGVLLRRHRRGDHERAGQGHSAARRGTDVGVFVQGEVRRPARDRPHPQRERRPRGQRPPRGRPAADHRRAGERIRRLPPVV